MQPLDDFLKKTHDHLGSLVAQARVVRRSISERHACPERAACKHCTALAEIHARIDDCLDQLDIAALDPDPEPDDCIVCGRRRYTDGVATLCVSCDGLVGNGRTWAALPDRESV